MQLGLTEDFGWHRWQGDDCVVWFAGHVIDRGRTLQAQAAARHLSRIASLGIDGMAAALRQLDGHFGLVIEKSGRVVVVTDRIRSIPLFYAQDKHGFGLDSNARRLLAASSDTTLDPDGGLAVAMSGYTVGPATLYRHIRQVEPGALVVFDGERAETRRYYTYDAWKKPQVTDREAAKRQHGELIRRIFGKLAAGLDGRPVFVPLSGGLDSRLVAAGLAEVGYRNVACFAYGRAGNFEAERSREVAEKLGIPWLFVPHSPATMRAFLKSDTYAAHLRFVDTCASVPFLQDLFAIDELKRRKAVPADAVFINGQSGDFIAGNHVPEVLRQPHPELSKEERRARIIAALIAKHFSLWRDLKTPENLARIGALLDERITAANVPDVPASADHGVYELVEFQERQAKFVVRGQRVYDFFGHDWRLPLWDVEYIDFWERMPLEFKAGQGLYREWLAEANWGGVWHPLLPNRTTVPRWAHYMRAAASVPVKLLGNDAWQSFDRRVFSHLTDLLCTVQAVPWSRALFDTRGFRHGLSFRSELYLSMHGVSVDGQRRIGPAPAATTLAQ